MWCVIPAAGRGSRMGPAASDRPKALLEVGGRPLVAWLIESFGPAVTDACVIVDDAPGTERRFRDALAPHARHVALHFAVQPSPKGVGDAVLRVGNSIQGAFVVVMGDGYYGSSLAPYLEAWRRSGSDGAVLVEPRHRAAADPAGWVRAEGGLVCEIYKSAEPGRARLRLAGMAVLPEAALTLDVLHPSPGTGELEVEQIVSRLIEHGMDFRAIPYDGWRRNVNHPKDLDRIRRRLARAALVETSYPRRSEEPKGNAT